MSITPLNLLHFQTYFNSQVCPRRMLYTPALSRLIAWSEDGKAFTVFYPTEFARTVLPQFFKHSNFASFIRKFPSFHLIS